jgi:hypothetical protein
MTRGLTAFFTLATFFLVFAVWNSWATVQSRIETNKNVQISCLKALSNVVRDNITRGELKGLAPRVVGSYDVYLVVNGKTSRALGARDVVGDNSQSQGGSAVEAAQNLGTESVGWLNDYVAIECLAFVRPVQWKGQRAVLIAKLHRADVEAIPDLWRYFLQPIVVFLMLSALGASWYFGMQSQARSEQDDNSLFASLVRALQKFPDGGVMLVDKKTMRPIVCNMGAAKMLGRTIGDLLDTSVHVLSGMPRHAEMAARFSEGILQERKIDVPFGPGGDGGTVALLLSVYDLGTLYLVRIKTPDAEVKAGR